MQRRSLTNNGMKGALQISLALLFLAALLGGVGCSTGGQEAMATSGPKITVSPSTVEYERKVKVTISGSGFQPKQQVGLLVDMGGAPSDISNLLKPKPVTDEKGEFSSVWTIDGEIRRKLVKPASSYTIEAIDQDWRPLAKTTLAFKEAAKKKK